MGVLKIGVFLDSSRHTQAFSKMGVLGKAVFTPGIQLVLDGPTQPSFENGISDENSRTEGSGGGRLACII